MLRDRHLSFNCKQIAIKFKDELRKILIPIKKKIHKGNVQREYAKHVLEMYEYTEGQTEMFYTMYRETIQNQKGLGEAMSWKEEKPKHFLK